MTSIEGSKEEGNNQSVTFDIFTTEKSFTFTSDDKERKYTNVLIWGLVFLRLHPIMIDLCT